MIRNYTFFDKEDFEGRTVQYEFDAPFYENMDEDLKMVYGEELTFVKEINHRDKIIRIHSGYDSGKGTLYVPPKPRKKPRRKLPLKIRDILAEKPKHNKFVLEMQNVYYDEKVHIMMSETQIHIFTESSLNEVTGSVSGYRNVIDMNEKRFVNYLKEMKFYPLSYRFIEFVSK